jgi:hypothetical protein
MTHTSIQDPVSERTARVLVDSFVADHVRKAHSSASGIRSAGGRAAIAVIGVGIAALLAGLIAASVVTGAYAVLAGITAAASAVIGVRSAVASLLWARITPYVKEYEMFETELLTQPAIIAELSNEVAHQVNENGSVDFDKVIINVGRRHGLFLRTEPDASWEARCHIDRYIHVPLNR